MRKNNPLFSLALSILDQIQELKEIITSKSAEKVKILERIPKRARDGSSLTVMKQLFLDKKIEGREGRSQKYQATRE